MRATAAHRGGRIALGIPLAIAVGGALGAVARYGIALWAPPGAGSFPWGTFVVNVTGCVAIGVLMVLLIERGVRAHRLVRPFLGIGVLGGFTTFSTYTVDIHQLLRSGATDLALVYLFATVAAALVAVEIGMVMTRVATRATAPSGGRRR